MTTPVLARAPGPSTAPTTLAELAALFFRLGATALGGPAAHIALMQDEVVRRRRWLTDEQFLDLLGATNLIPGPSSTELAIHIGFERRRWAGLVVAGVAFILPAVAISVLCADAYVRFGSTPAVGWLLYGVKPVVLAIVVQAMATLLPKAARSAPLRLVGLVAALLVLFGIHELAVLLGAGLVTALLARASASGPRGGASLQLAPIAALSLGSGAAAGVTANALFWVFFKTGAVLFGSGYVLLALLRAELVERLGWLSEAQLIDAIAVGQVTPGPVFSTATFIGYLLAGGQGAALATCGIFLPAFVFVAVSGPLIPRLRASPLAAAFLDGVNVASLALMLVVTLQLGRAALVDPLTIGLGVVSAFVLLRWKPNPTWLIAASALVSALAHAWR